MTTRNPESGGRYVVDKPGREAKRQGGTASHREGDRARDARGNRLNRPGEANAATASKVTPTTETED
jgi:hypothetical protein